MTISNHMTVIFSKALKNSGTWTAKTSDSLVQIFDKYHDFHTNPSRKSSANTSCSLAVGIQRSLSTDAPPTAMTLFAFNRITIPLVALLYIFMQTKYQMRRHPVNSVVDFCEFSLWTLAQSRCGLWRILHFTRWTRRRFIRMRRPHVHAARRRLKPRSGDSTT